MGEGMLTDSSALSIYTGEFSGRSRNDKFTVKDEVTTETVHWNNFNLPIEEKYFHIIHNKIMDYLNENLRYGYGIVMPVLTHVIA